MNTLLNTIATNVDIYDGIWIVVTVIGLVYAVLITAGRGADLYYFYRNGWNGDGLKQAWDSFRWGFLALFVQSFLAYAGYLGATTPTPAAGYTDRQIAYRLWAIGAALVIMVILWLSQKTRAKIRRNDAAKH